MPRLNAPGPALPRGPRPIIALAVIVTGSVVALALQPTTARSHGRAAAPGEDGVHAHVYLPHLLASRSVQYEVLGVLPAGQVRAVAQRGDRVYAVQEAEIVVIAITDVQRPAVVGRVPAVGEPQDLAIAGGRLAALRTVGDKTYVDTYDLADPDHPRSVGTVETEWVGYDGFATLEGYGDYLLESYSCRGLRILDVRGPGPARVVAEADTTAWGYLEGVIGHVAILHTGHCSRFDPPSTLVTVDLRDPLHPRMTGELRQPEWPHSDVLQIIGARNTLFGVIFRQKVFQQKNTGAFAVLVAATDDGTLRQYDTVRIDDSFERAATDSTGHLYVSSHTDGQYRTQAIWLGSATAPAWNVAGSLATAPRSALTASLGLVAGWDPGRNTLTSMDFRDVAKPGLGIDLVIAPFSRAFDVAATGGVAYVKDGPDAITPVDFRTEQAAGRRLGRIEPVPDGIVAMLAYESRLYLLGDDLWVADVSDPSRPHLVAGVPRVFGSRLVQAGDRLVALANSGPSEHGLTVLSLADPDHPSPLASVAGLFSDVAATGHGLVAVGPGPVVAGDMTFLYAMTLAGDRPLQDLGKVQISVGFPAGGKVAAIGRQAYVLRGNEWTGVDLTDPTAPRVVDSRNLPLAGATSITVLDDTRLLVSGADQAVVQLDPIAGTFIAHRFPIEGGAAVDGPVGYVAAGEAGLWRLALGAR
jgi:hypothetical protein